MATSYAITATGNTFYPLAVIAHDKATAAQRARDIRTETGTDIYRETEHKNLRIVAKSSLRKYHMTEDMLDVAFESF